MVYLLDCQSSTLRQSDIFPVVSFVATSQALTLFTGIEEATARRGEARRRRLPRKQLSVGHWRL